MKNWNTNEEKFSTSEEKRLWQLQQMILYGFDGETITKEELLQHWPKLRDTIDPEKQRLFELFLWNKRYSLPISKKSFYRQHEIKKLPTPSI
jgi:hypothetical protein